MVTRDHKLSMRKQCELLQLSRSRLYYQPVGESAENLRFMEIIDKQFEPPRVYRRVKLSKGEPHDRQETHPELHGRVP
ncbi:hypothetical protein SAMN04490248_14813, partial [Salinihabitans flavidus]